MKPAPILAIALTLAASSAWSADYKVGSIEIDGPWSRATPKGAKVAGGYLRITNTGSTPDRLTGGTFAPAGGVEIHQMSMDRGVMRMRELKEGLEIKPGATIELQPSSNHLMFIDLKRPLAVEVEYAVEAIGAGRPSGHAGH
jgi:periplasmic copper chaperone A